MIASADTIWDVRKQFPVADKYEAEDTRGYISENRRNGGAGDAPGGKAPMPFDKQIIEKKIDHAGENIVNKGQLCFSSFWPKSQAQTRGTYLLHQD